MMKPELFNQILITTQARQQLIDAIINMIKAQEERLNRLEQHVSNLEKQQHNAKKT